MATDKVDDISMIVVSAKVLANIIGVTDRSIRKMAEDGLLKKNSSGKYLLQQSLKNYIINLKVDRGSQVVQSDLDGETLNLDDERAIHERVKRHITELRLALMEGKCHTSDDVKEVMTDMIANFKTKMLSLPSKATPNLVERDKAFILDYLTKEVNQILVELSEYNPADFYGKDYVELDTEDGVNDE